MTALLERLLVPVATVDDAQATAQALERALGDQIGEVLGVHVIEKGGGSLDKAPLAAREADADEVLGTLEDALEAAGIEGRGEVLYGTDVIGAIVDAVDEERATAIAFCPRPSGFLTRLLTGDRARALLEEAPVPVVSLPLEEAHGR